MQNAGTMTHQTWYSKPPYSSESTDIAVLAERPAFDEYPSADFRWWSELPLGCGLLRRSSGMAMVVAAVVNGALALLMPRLVLLLLLLWLALAEFSW